MKERPRTRSQLERVEQSGMRVREKPKRVGIILCAGKNTEQMELLELGSAGIHVAEYLTILPPPEVMYAKLHEAIETARTRIEGKPREVTKSSEELP